jgi:hypothetical protein
MDKVSRHVSRRNLEAVVPLFEPIARLPADEKESELLVVLKDFNVRTMVLHLGERVVRQVVETLAERPELARHLQVIGELYQLDPSRENGLAANTDVLLDAWCLSLIPLISDSFKGAHLDIDQLEEVICGHIGFVRLRDVLLHLINSISGGPNLVFAD